MAPRIQNPKFDLSVRGNPDQRSLLIAMAVAAFAAANVMLLSVSVWSGHGEMGETTRRIHGITIQYIGVANR